MRQFTDLDSAILEIRRDLTRALPQPVTGVQQDRDRALIAREALNYSYSLPLSETLVHDPDQFRRLMLVLHPNRSEQEIQLWFDWMGSEFQARSFGTAQNTRIAMLGHPLEEAFREGFIPSYLYSHRLRMAGGLKAIAEILNDNPSSRRAYLPVFHPEDTMRGAMDTRVPCSLGFHFMIRRDGQISRLHTTYYMRSCDFDTFWLTDLILASRMAERVRLMVDLPLVLGNIVHDIVSFHLLRPLDDPTGEIY